MKDVTFTQFKKKAALYKGKIGAVVAAAGAATLIAQNAMSQTLGTAVSDATTAMVTDAGGWIAGIFAIVALSMLVGLGISWLSKSKRG